jgi:hypothetical protein
MKPTKMRIRIQPSKSVPKGKMNPKTQKALVVGGLAVGALALIGIAYAASRSSAAAANKTAAATASAPQLMVDGSTGITSVRPGIPVQFSVRGTPGDAVLINSQPISQNGGAMSGPSTIAAGTFDTTGQFSYSTVFGLNPNGPATPSSLPLLANSLPYNGTVTFNFTAIDKTAQSQSNTVQVSSGIQSRANG